MDRGRRTTGMIDPVPSQRVLGDSIQGQDAAGHYPAMAKTRCPESAL